MDDAVVREPAALRAILRDTHALGFDMVSESKVGALLAVLAASKPAGRLLELGTGTGHGTAWLLQGMDAMSTLDTVETNPAVVEVARKHLGADARVRFHVIDGADFIRRATPGHFDLIYADAWPGKFTHLDETLELLRPGGLYMIDDVMPQASWPDAHAPNVERLLRKLEQSDYASVKLAWASGLMLLARHG